MINLVIMRSLLGKIRLTEAFPIILEGGKTQVSLGQIRVELLPLDDRSHGNTALESGLNCSRVLRQDSCYQISTKSCSDGNQLPRIHKVVLSDFAEMEAQL